MQDILMHAYDFATDAQGINAIVENPAAITSFITDFHPFGVCVEDCPKAGDYICTPDFEGKVPRERIKECHNKDGLQLAAEKIAGHIGVTTDCEQILANCFPVAVDNEDYFLRCLPIHGKRKAKEEGCVA